MTDCCAVLGLARSSYYHASQPRDDGALRKAIAEIAAKYPTYGSRRIQAQLRREPYFIVVGRNLISQLMQQMNLLVKHKRRKRSTTDSQHEYRRFPNLVKGIEATRPDQLWVADITYVRLPWDDIYLAIVMDVYTRAIRGWHLGWSLGQELTLGALQQAFLHHPRPDIHHSDQGTQYAANAYIKQLQDAGSQISMASAGEPSENGYAERVIRTIKEEEVYLSDYQNMAQAREEIGHFIDVVYQHKRIHSALGYLTPAEFEAQWQKNTPSNSRFLCPVF